jgi:hypothetical protein
VTNAGKAVGTSSPPDQDFYDDMRPILEDDLAAFVREEDRHRSLTVVREAGDRDVVAETKRWLDKLHVDSADVDACTAMRAALERWADGSRDGQLRGALALVRLDERGHHGLAAALDELWSVRTKDTHDFRRIVEFARNRVVAAPSAAEDMGCNCPNTFANHKIRAEQRDAHQVDEQRGDEDELAQLVHRLQLRRQATRIVDAMERPPAAEPGSVSLRELLARERTSTKYRIDRLWPTGGKVLITAPKKSGKTTLVGNLIRCLVDGDQFLSRPVEPGEFKVAAFGFEVQRTERVVMLLDFEMTEDMLCEWLADQRIMNSDQVHIELLRGRTWDPRDDDQRRRWAKYLRALKAGALIIDPIGPILHGLGIDENSNSEVGRFLAALDKLVHETGIDEHAVVHHAGHGTDQRARGASAFLGWPDAIWQMTRSDYGSFLSAEGRDVLLPETALMFNRATRRLSLGEGNRVTSRNAGHIDTVAAIVTESPGLSVRKLAPLVGDALGVGTEAARTAVKATVSAGRAHVHLGANRVQMHHPGPRCRGVPECA